MSLLLLLLLLLLLPINSISSSPPCYKDHHKLLSLAFHSVSNFNLSHCSSSPLTILKLPSLNLTGTISWLYLTNISTLQVLDLSHNSLTGSIPGSFWSSSSSLTHLNLAGNHLGGTLRFPSSSSLLSLNLSNNHFTKLSGLHLLSSLQVLDLSLNSINGVFPSDFPPLTNLHFLNLSFNNLSGFLSPKTLSLFGSSSFQQAGSLITFSPPPPPPPHNKTNNNKEKNKKHKRSHKVVVVVISATSVLLFFTLLTIIIFLLRRRRRRRRRRGEGNKGRREGDDENDEEKVVEQCATWVAEAKWSSPVVIFEKPLMELTFADLATATSCFSKDSQLADGHRCGALYRAVLAGDMHVVIRVLKSGAGCDAEELSQLRHPNLLPLLGYCLAGKEKLFLYEYMEKGDMRRWLNELPAAKGGEEEEEEKLELCDWPVRHKVALGVARGLAFLHQGSRRPVVHGHLVPANVLLDDEMEARIADFGVVDGGEGSVAEDVYGFGLLVLELVTGRRGWSEKEVERVRTTVRGGRAAEVVDVELRRKEGWSPEMEKEMVEFVRVGYLCTAQCEVKRPTMHQVVGLLKDIRPIC